MKAVLRGKFITLNAYIKKLEKSHTSELKEHLKTVEQKETNLSERNIREMNFLKAFLKVLVQNEKS